MDNDSAVQADKGGVNRHEEDQDEVDHLIDGI